jgi:hypothetical protein
MELKSLKHASVKTGLSTEQLRWMIYKGRLKAHQPGGPRGKIFVSEIELERLMQPLTVGQE